LSNIKHPPGKYNPTWKYILGVLAAGFMFLLGIIVNHFYPKIEKKEIITKDSSFQKPAASIVLDSSNDNISVIQQNDKGKNEVNIDKSTKNTTEKHITDNSATYKGDVTKTVINTQKIKRTALLSGDRDMIDSNIPRGAKVNVFVEIGGGSEPYDYGKIIYNYIRSKGIECTIGSGFVGGGNPERVYAFYLEVVDSLTFNISVYNEWDPEAINKSRQNQKRVL